MRPAAVTFDTRLDANAWCKAQALDVDRGLWTPPREQQTRHGVTIREYSTRWLAQREIKPRTRMQYRMLLEHSILPNLGDVLLDQLSPSTVRTWHASLNAATPTMRAQAYSLLRAMYATAFADELISANPCRIRGAGQSRTRHETRPATLSELTIIVEELPDRYRAMALLAAWCALRFGELTELRRGDVDLEARVLRVQRGVTRVDGEFIVGDPKSQAGRRTVAIPPHLIDVVRRHLADHVDKSPGALLFPARGGGHMQPSSLYKVWYPARDKAGRPDLRFHDLRHTGATLAAVSGATLAELMNRLGHSTPAAAMIYQHASADRDQVIAEALSQLAAGNVVPIKRGRTA